MPVVRPHRRRPFRALPALFGVALLAPAAAEARNASPLRVLAASTEVVRSDGDRFVTLADFDDAGVATQTLIDTGTGRRSTVPEGCSVTLQPPASSRALLTCGAAPERLIELSTGAVSALPQSATNGDGDTFDVGWMAVGRFWAVGFTTGNVYFNWRTGEVRQSGFDGDPGYAEIDTPGLVEPCPAFRPPKTVPVLARPTGNGFLRDEQSRLRLVTCSGKVRLLSRDYAAPQLGTRLAVWARTDRPVVEAFDRRRGRTLRWTVPGRTPKGVRTAPIGIVALRDSVVIWRKTRERCGPYTCSSTLRAWRAKLPKR